MARLNTEVDVRHPRRALHAGRVCQAGQFRENSDEDIQCYGGEERARIYMLSYMTGLRRKEIAQPDPAELQARRGPADRDGRGGVFQAPPTRRAAAASGAGSRACESGSQGLDGDEPLFPKLEKRRTWLMVKKDLERVGIPYENEGRHCRLPCRRSAHAHHRPAPERSIADGGPGAGSPLGRPDDDAVHPHRNRGASQGRGATELVAYWQHFARPKQSRGGLE